MNKKLTIIIPAYNEEKTIYNILSRVAAIKLVGNLEKEIVVVDDYSTDHTLEEVQKFLDQHPEESLTVTSHSKNMGKGSAIHTGINKAKGEFIIVQDADLEYDPNEFNKLLKPMLNGVADVVYGSRFKGGQPHRILFFGIVLETSS